MEDLTQKGFAVLGKATKLSNSLPAGSSRDMYESYPAFHSVMANQGVQILEKLSEVLKHVGSSGNIVNRDDEEKFEMIVDANDSILERVGILLDQMDNIRGNPQVNYAEKAAANISGTWNKKFLQNRVLNNEAQIVKNTRNIEKPQLNFKDKPNNDRDVPFEPNITYKPNLLKPLAIFAEENDSDILQFCHPYEFELERFKPDNKYLCPVTPVPCKELSETPLKLISSTSDLALMISDLKNYNEIGVDLEHHNYRSFQGFTCLLQISTRDIDYIVDTLVLREELTILNEVFTDPRILKIFHGADSDIVWLQKDFSVYVVNMFDSFFASKLLNFPQLSLAFLMKRFCNVDAQKHFQLADWRVRPLPEELLNYARQDTHHLLFIHDNLKNLLIEKANGQTNLLESVISSSKIACLKKYIKPVWDEEGYTDMHNRSKRLFDNRQLYALKHLYEWRDSTARKNDESPGYVLPNHMLLHISETLPREIQGILACCNPVPALVRQNLNPIHQIILKAREQPLVKPVEEERRYIRTAVENTVSSESPLRCFHDLSYEPEFRDDLPVLLGSGNKEPIDFAKEEIESMMCTKPIVDVFESTPAKINEKAESSCKSKNVTPQKRKKQEKPLKNVKRGAKSNKSKA